VFVCLNGECACGSTEGAPRVNLRAVFRVTASSSVVRRWKSLGYELVPEDSEEVWPLSSPCVPARVGPRSVVRSFEVSGV
jgi:hypothetical protein